MELPEIISSSHGIVGIQRGIIGIRAWNEAVVVTIVYSPSGLAACGDFINSLNRGSFLC